MTRTHVPVLAGELIDILDPHPGETAIDCTFGAGGHARLVAERIGPAGTLVCIDRDPVAAVRFDQFATEVPCETRFLSMEFADALRMLRGEGLQADLAYLDLGVSSMQIDRPERGFSYAVDAPLDMRMDPSADVTAAGIVNEAAERDLATIFRRYGEERYAKQIARAIVRRRKEQRFERTSDLVETIKAAIPAPARFGDGHPAKRVFQALRIAVNDELGALESALPSAFAMLRPGGRLAVISFHSLEDRITKRFMRDLERGCECPPDFPVCVCGKEPQLRSLSRKAIRPSPRETAANPRSSSARLRVAVKV
jgi:16S rRNA (cytosine1402-N4)-methyltransferase